MTTEIKDLLNPQEENKLPSGLNVLTILTYVGCGIAALFTLFTPMIYKFTSSMMEKALSSGQELSQKQMADIEKGKAAMELANKYMVPNIIVGLVGIILCFVGAMWMRKLKKDGFWIYVAGEILPLIVSLILMGTAMFTGITSIIFAVGIPVLFIILYSMQRKHLVK